MKRNIRRKFTKPISSDSDTSDNESGEQLEQEESSSSDSVVTENLKKKKLAMMQTKNKGSKVVKTATPRRNSSVPFEDDDEDSSLPSSSKQAPVSKYKGNSAASKLNAASTSRANAKDSPSKRNKNDGKRNPALSQTRGGNRQQSGGSGQPRPSGSPRAPNPKRRKVGTLALREIKHYQKSFKVLISKLPFSRLVKGILNAIPTGPYKISATAIEALQEATEDHLVHLFEDSLLCTLHRGCITLTLKDMMVTRRIRKRFEDY